MFPHLSHTWNRVYRVVSKRKRGPASITDPRRDPLSMPIATSFDYRLCRVK
jgi:hypothetical protein